MTIYLFIFLADLPFSASAFFSYSNEFYFSKLDEIVRNCIFKN